MKAGISNICHVSVHVPHHEGHSILLPRPIYTGVLSAPDVLHAFRFILPAPKMTRRSTPDSSWCSWGIRNLHSILPVFPIIQELWHSTLWRVRTSFRSQGCLVESKHLAKGRSESGFVATFHLQSSVHLRRCPHEILRTDSSFVLWSTAPKAKCMPITKAEKGSDNLTSYQDSVKINTYQALQVLSA